MTNFEYIKQAIIKEDSVEKLAKILCNCIDKAVSDCEFCPFTDRCYRGHNGVLDFLQAERGE